MQVPANILVVTDEVDPPYVDALRRDLPLSSTEIVDRSGARDMLAGNALEIDAVVAIEPTGNFLFLDDLRREHPHIARLAIAPSPKRARSLEATRIAHAAVAPSADVTALSSAIERTVAMRWRLHDPDLRRLVDDIEMLPTPPETIVQLTAALNDPDVEIHEVAAIIQSDPAMTARLVRLVNSAGFGLPHPMNHLDQIVAYLGLCSVRNLLAADELVTVLSLGPEELFFDVAQHQKHATHVARLAQQLISDRANTHDVFLAGLLHDIGLLALLHCAPVRYLALRHEVLLGERPMEACELDVLGTTHAAIGAHLLETWHFPAPICAAVALSHEAGNLENRRPDMAQSIFAAETISTHDSQAQWWETVDLPQDAYFEELDWWLALQANNTVA